MSVLFVPRAVPAFKGEEFTKDSSTLNAKGVFGTYLKGTEHVGISQAVSRMYEMREKFLELPRAFDLDELLDRMMRWDWEARCYESLSDLKRLAFSVSSASMGQFQKITPLEGGLRTSSR